MADIEGPFVAKFEETMNGMKDYVKGAPMLKRLLVFVVAVVGAVFAFKWLREQGSKLLDG